MSAYLSFYKDKELKEHMLTVSRVNSLSEVITDNIEVGGSKMVGGNIVLYGMELNNENMEVAYKGLQEDINNMESIISLSLIKRDFDEFDLKENIDMLYELIQTMGKLQILSEILVDNNNILYTVYG